MALLKAVLDTLDGVEEHFHALYTSKNGKFEFSGVEGMKTSADTDRLQTALNAERTISKNLKVSLEAWGDRRPEDVLPALEQIPELKILAEKGNLKKDEKEIEAIVNGRLAPLQQKLEAVTRKEAELAAKVSEYSAKDTRRTIYDSVRKYATETKALPESYGSEMGGLMLLAKEVFTLDSAGQVVVKEGAPGMVHGTHIKDAFPEIQKGYGYLWPQSQGGGAGGSTTTSSAGANPFKGNDLTARTKFASENPPDKVAAAMSAAGISTQWQLHKTLPK